MRLKVTAYNLKILLTFTHFGLNQLIKKKNYYLAVIVIWTVRG